MAKPDFQLQWGVNRVGGIPATDPADYQLGWQYRGGLPPLTGNFDYYQSLADERMLYLNAQGIAEWDALTAYDTDAYAKGSDGELYRSTAPTTGNDPTLGGPWVLAFADTLNTVRQDVASTGTVVLPTTTRHVNITGAATITAFTVAAGQCYFVRFDAGATLTNNASIVTQRGEDIVATSGDTCLIRATAANTVEVLCYSKSLSASSVVISSGTNANGSYQVWSDGVIKQWGSGTVTGQVDEVITFPIPFISPVEFGVLSDLGAANGQQDFFVTNSWDASLTTVTINCNQSGANGFLWEAKSR